MLFAHPEHADTLIYKAWDFLYDSNSYTKKSNNNNKRHLSGEEKKINRNWMDRYETRGI